MLKKHEGELVELRGCWAHGDEEFPPDELFDPAGTLRLRCMTSTRRCMTSARRCMTSGWSAKSSLARDLAMGKVDHQPLAGAYFRPHRDVSTAADVLKALAVGSDTVFLVARITAQHWVDERDDDDHDD